MQMFEHPVQTFARLNPAQVRTQAPTHDAARRARAVHPWTADFCVCSAEKSA